jgi:hypothetical protein
LLSASFKNAIHQLTGNFKVLIASSVFMAIANCYRKVRLQFAIELSGDSRSVVRNGAPRRAYRCISSYFDAINAGGRPSTGTAVAFGP